MNKFNELMRIGEAAKYLGTSVFNVRHWTKTGKLSCYTSPTNRYRYYHFKELHDLLIALNSSRSIDKNPK